MKIPRFRVLALRVVWCLAAASLACAAPGTAGEAADRAEPAQARLARLHSLEKIHDATAVEAECRALLKAELTPEERVAVYKALVGATEGDKRIAALEALPADFPEKEGLDLFVTAIRDSQAYRSLDYYKLMAARYGDKVTAEVVDRAARPLLNERRDWIGGAEEVVKAALERFPRDSRLLDILADVYRRSRRGKESLDLQRQAVQNAKTPEIKKAMYDRLAYNLRLQRMDAEALQVPYDIVREWPDHDWACQALDALALRQLRSAGIEAARKVYQWYLETYPKGKWAEQCQLSLPMLHQLDGQYDLAAAEMTRIRALVGERTQRNIDRNLKGMPSLEGQVLDKGGQPIAGATLTLARPSPFRDQGDHLIMARTKSDAQGRFVFRNLPYHTHYEFLAATRPDDPVTCLSTTFGPKDFPLELNDHKTMDIRFGRPLLRRLPDPTPPDLANDDGVARRHLRTFALRDWTGRPWPRSPLHYEVELPAGVKPSSLRLVDQRGQVVPFQLAPRDERRGVLTFFSALPASASVAYFLFGGEQDAKPPQLDSPFSVQKADGNVVEVSTGAASFRVPVGTAQPVPMAISAAPAPILAVKGPGGVWLGKGSFRGGGQVTGLAATWLEEGPLMRRLRLKYDLEGGGAYEATLTFLAGEPYVLVAEKCSGAAGEFRFSAFPGLQPNRAALCWINKLHVEEMACKSRRNLIQMHRYIMWA
ncbi:MAG: carboxypeptidase-like regulatory domain-containing protein, partial [Planctomycetota bacterium]|nr:carboxypeptidase-like regulatory domain-containing protein [Planctomycetota bacterium]